MSLNLYIEFDNQNIEIYQTPTYITCMCLMTDIGTKSEMTGKQAKRAVNCYLQYVQSLITSTVYLDHHSFTEYCRPINKHLKEIRLRLQSAKKIRVYLL
jgi:hypothetical protein